MLGKICGSLFIGVEKHLCVDAGGIDAAGAEQIKSIADHFIAAAEIHVGVLRQLKCFEQMGYSPEKMVLRFFA